MKIEEAFTGSAEAADDMLIDTGLVTTGTDGVAINDVMGGDIATGEVEIPGTVEARICVEGGPARGVWLWAAW